VRPYWFSEGESDRVRVVGAKEEEGSVANEARGRKNGVVEVWVDSWWRIETEVEVC
jgi:hypothetical protein